MEILEYGKKENKKIILIHGFETPYQIWEKYIEHFKGNYHIIMPILQGHNPKQKEDFISFEQSAKDIEDYYISRYGQNVFAVYGMSMGGILATKLWENRDLNIDKLILESSPLISCNGIMTSMMIQQYLMLTHKTQRRDKKIIAQAVNSIISEDKLKEFLEMIDTISDTTIKNYIRQIGKYKLPADMDTQNTEIYYYYGTKINELLAKKTAGYIRKNYPNAKITCFKGKGHCEDSLLHPSVMIAELDKILGMSGCSEL